MGDGEKNVREWKGGRGGKRTMGRAKRPASLFASPFQRSRALSFSQAPGAFLHLSPFSCPNDNERGLSHLVQAVSVINSFMYTFQKMNITTKADILSANKLPNPNDVKHFCYSVKTEKEKNTIGGYFCGTIFMIY